MFWHMGSGMAFGWGWPIGGLMMVVFWVAVIALIVWGVGAVSWRHAPMLTTTHAPLDIAKERYAKGEITKEQFDELKRDLSV